MPGLSVHGLAVYVTLQPVAANAGSVGSTATPATATTPTATTASLRREKRLRLSLIACLLLLIASHQGEGALACRALAPLLTECQKRRRRKCRSGSRR
jgi:hypothetical protein